MDGGVWQGEIPGSSNHAGIRSSRDLVLEKLNIHGGYQQMDESTKNNVFSFRERKKKAWCQGLNKQSRDETITQVIEGW